MVKLGFFVLCREKYSIWSEPDGGRRKKNTPHTPIPGVLARVLAGHGAEVTV